MSFVHWIVTYFTDEINQREEKNSGYQIENDVHIRKE